MATITRQERTDNRWLTWVLLDGYNTMMLETENKITEEEADDLLEEIMIQPEEQDGSTN